MENNLKHLKDYVVRFFDMILKKYSDLYVRKTEIATFDKVRASNVAISNKKLYVVNHDGTDVTNFPLDIGEKIRKGVALADFNENALDDIVFGTENDHVYLILDDGIVKILPFLSILASCLSE